MPPPIPESFNGRTADFESANHGSNPCSGTNKPRQLAGGVFLSLSTTRGTPYRLPVLGLQTIFTCFIGAVLTFLVFDGLRSGGVWVRGGRSGEPGASWNTHKAYRGDSPRMYWLVMAFYIVSLVFLVVISVMGRLNGY